MKKVTIFKIRQDKDRGYDTYGGHIIAGFNEVDVRSLAVNKSADEGEEAWLDGDIEIMGDYTGPKAQPFILLSDFRAG